MMDKGKFNEILKAMEVMVMDEQKIVTFKSLVRSFNVNPNTAKQLLYTFASTCGNKFGEMSCAYHISGRKQDGSFYSTIINDKDLDDARNSFNDIFSETVYSVQPTKDLNDLQILYSVDKFEDTSDMSAQVITCTECTAKPDHLIAVKPVVQVLKTKPAVEKTKNEADKTEPKKSPIKKEESKPQAKKPKPNAISSMFAAQNQKPKTEKIVNKVDDKQDKEKVEDKPVMKNEKPKTKRKIKAKSKDDPKEKRKRIRVFSSSEDEDAIEEKEEKERSPSPVPVHEPIVEIEEEIDVVTQKRKKRKIVDKTVMTEEGYIETIKEVVYQTDSEEDQPSTSKIQEKKSPKKVEPKPVPKKPLISPKKGKQKPSTDGRKQQSLLSFFKKT